MDTSETYIKMCEQAVEIQDSQKYKSFKTYGDPLHPTNNALILGSMSFYAIHNEDGYYSVSGFATNYVWNGTVLGYVLRPANITGCAVRGDLPIAYTNSEVIWLPRQDQLQEMVIYRFSAGIWELLNKFCEFGDSIVTYGDIPSAELVKWRFTSMEQLWLAFYMSETHSKYWDGGKWVKLS